MNHQPPAGLPSRRIEGAGDMAVYDRLPPAVRAALAAAVLDISAASVRDAIEAGHGEAAVLRTIARLNERARAAWREDAA